MVCLQVMAQHGPGLTPSALDAMTYTDAVIKEVLRVTPPSASVFRKATVDLEVNRMPLGGGGGASRRSCTGDGQSVTNAAQPRWLKAAAAISHIWRMPGGADASLASVLWRLGPV
jgi:hypothetical protein